MKVKLPAFLMLILIFGALLILSCSSDESTGPTDAELEALMRAQVSQDISAVLSSISYAFGQFDGFDDTLDAGDILGKIAAPTDPQDTLYYKYENGWHIAYLDQYSTATINDLSITYDATICDSVQFRNNGDIVQIPDDNTDYLDFNFWMAMMLDMQVADTSLTMNIDNYHVDCLLDVQPDGNVLVNGDIDLDYSIFAVQGSDHAQGHVLYSLTVDDLEITDPDGCPIGGTIAAALSLELQGPEGAANGEWTITVTFLSDSQMHVVADGPRLHLDFTEAFECGGGFLASPVQAFISNR